MSSNRFSLESLGYNADGTFARRKKSGPCCCSAAGMSSQSLCPGGAPEEHRRVDGSITSVRRAADLTNSAPLLIFSRLSGPRSWFPRRSGREGCKDHRKAPSSATSATKDRYERSRFRQAGSRAPGVAG